MERNAKISAGRLAKAFGRTLVLLPHHDDECAAGALLHELRAEAMVLFLTDSAPVDSYFWGKYGSRERYRALRQQESLETLRGIEVEARFGAEEVLDQQLYRRLPQALDAALAAAFDWKPKTVLAPAYEGGHPDHDCASYLAAVVAKETGAQHWELPYYHRTRSGKYRQQEFLAHASHPVEWDLTLDEAELERKRAMWSRYESQCQVLRDFAVERESYRRAPVYEYGRAPHAGVLNYEAWGWPVSGRQVVEAIAALREEREAARNLHRGGVESTVRRLRGSA